MELLRSVHTYALSFSVRASLAFFVQNRNQQKKSVDDIKLVLITAGWKIDEIIMFKMNKLKKEKKKGKLRKNINYL